MIAQLGLTAEDETPAVWEEDAAERSFAGPRPEAATIPTASASAITATTGTAIRAVRLFPPGRRRTDRWPLSI